VESSKSLFCLHKGIKDKTNQLAFVILYIASSFFTSK
jgi:hypothetical protein